MIDEYEAYIKRFQAETQDRMETDGSLNLEGLPPGSSLEMCFVLVS